MANMTFEQWAEKTETTLDELSRVIKIKLFQGIIMDTRVDTGRMRGNWQIQTGSPILWETSNKDGDRAMNAVVDGVTSGVDYLSNNVPYVAFWEQHDGMVAKNVLRINRNIKKILRDAG